MTTENDAALLLGSMLFAGGVDGAVSERERQALNALCKTVPELRSVNLDALLPKALPALQQAAAQPEWLRRKAFVLGLEVMVRGNSGEFEAANLKGANALWSLLRLSEDFAAATLFPLRCKYVAGDVDDEVALTIVAAMLAVAAADGDVSQAELTAVAQVLQ